MLKFAICDDEPFMVRQFTECLAQYMSANPRTAYQLQSFPDGKTLLEDGGEFDVIFLDVQMGPPDGMETARALRRRGDRSIIIFVTVLTECVYDSFEVEAYGYLVKPLDESRFRRTMDRALSALSQWESQWLLVQRGASCRKIPLSEIVYCEVKGRKVYIRQRDGTVTDFYERLENLESRLDARFFKCHRSYLVNLDYVRGCGSGQVVLSRDEKLPLSRLREREFRQALFCRMKEGGG